MSPIENKLLLISKDESLVETLRVFLSSVAPEYSVITEIESQHEKPDVAIVDVDTCVVTDYERLSCPVIILGKKMPDITRVPHAKFMSKPVDMRQLLMQIGEALKLASAAQEEVKFSHFVLKPSLKRLLNTQNNIEIKLTDAESAILLLLAEAKGAAVSGDALRKELGYVSTSDTHTLETHIYRLRQKIEAEPSEPKLLLTTEDGYMLSIIPKAIA